MTPPWVHILLNFKPPLLSLVKLLIALLAFATAAIALRRDSWPQRSRLRKSCMNQVRISMARANLWEPMIHSPGVC